MDTSPGGFLSLSKIPAQSHWLLSEGLPTQQAERNRDAQQGCIQAPQHRSARLKSGGTKSGSQAGREPEMGAHWETCIYKEAIYYT